jgi:murein DD-endopeptidase MepM/ murein hydrolase activator NlpD
MKNKTLLQFVLLLIFLIVFESCASVNLKKIQQVRQNPEAAVLALLPSTIAQFLPMQGSSSKYLKLIEKFKKFHDSGELSESDVTDILNESGVIKTSGKKTTKQTSKKSSSGSAQIPPPVTNYSGKFIWPLDDGVVSSEYGPRWGKEHKGLDLAADKFTPIKASAAGVVIYSDSGLRGYGNVVILRHDDARTSLYAHNEKNMVKKGTTVKQGEVIALLGSTGRSTGPHTHFEIRVGEHPMNPRDVLVKN